MNRVAQTPSVQKTPTGIPGFDFVSDGGIPTGRTALVAGSAGSGKTIFAAQFLAEGIRQHGEKGVFVTFEERPEDIRRNMISFG
jgi:circadian clock protein KaiC